MNGVGINPDYDYLFDPQQAQHYGFCERCRKEIYTNGDTLCYECAQEAETEFWKAVKRGRIKVF